MAPPSGVILLKNGNGEHAEEAAFRRANKKRLRGATLTIAGIRRRKGKFEKCVYVKPCDDKCLSLAKKHGIRTVEYTTKTTHWETFKL